jgi:hypothetical protein
LVQVETLISLKCQVNQDKPLSYIYVNSQYAFFKLNT